ncbi:MAG TPA: glycoside hydrolase family 38 C-terminal domain-containing protein, partial [Candidatus Kapabacteria bacterium]|nr:glycoside hydrolase family 38 C-terminal domain-containing protein [Candidatus Kapabacteria bacterium]
MAKTIHLIGNAHLDPAWMWRWPEGFAAFASTCRSALDRIAETDDFIFTVSSAACFEFIEQTDPVLFAKIQEAVKAGKWSLVGGWWIEADCNMPSGESLIRQGLYGQEYFRSRFGITCDTGYLIDSFGHAATLPMLLQACGMRNFIFMRPEEHEKKLPSALFNWKAPSGDEVLTYRIPLHYSNFALGVTEKIEKLPTYPSYSNEYPWMLFYGVGNHGGGPTKEQIRQILEARKEQGDEIIFSSPSNYFDEIRTLDPNIPTIEDEMQPHAIGCYSAHSEIKRLNRQAEFGLIRSEVFSALSEKVTGIESNWSSIQEAWKPVLLNQFHDTLGGVAIKEAMDDAVASYQEAISVAARNERLTLARIASKIDTSSSIETLIVFNPNSFEVTQPVEFELWNPEASEKGIKLSSVTLTDSKGAISFPHQIESSGKINGDLVRFGDIVTIPPLGWESFEIKREYGEPIVEEYKAVDPRLRIEIQIGSKKFIHVPALVLSDETDTWGHGITGFSKTEGEFKVIEVTHKENNAYRTSIRIRSTYNNSELIEEYRLYSHPKWDFGYIEHHVRLNWQEKRKVCKLRYPHGQSNPKATYEIAYGTIDRPADGNEVPAGTWAYVDGGLGLISPTKLSYSCDDKYLSLTIARSPLYAHHEPPHKLSDTEEKRYLDQGEQEFTNYIILHDGDWQSARMPHLTAQFSQPLVGHIEY